MSAPDPESPSPKKAGQSGASERASHYREAEVKSYGNMSDQHWSRTRGERNAEAIDYYRDRSQAPGVEGGGEARNYYCMECDGVIPWDDFEGDACPHCGVAIEGGARRYFNWVEIDRTPTSDRTAMAIALGIVVVVLSLFIAAIWWAFKG